MAYGKSVVYDVLHVEQHAITGLLERIEYETQGCDK